MDLYGALMAVIGSLGGGALVVLGFSNWLGKVWASRLMIEETAKYQRELEELKNINTRELESLKDSMLHGVESYKVKLKKSEMIFEKEYLAASDFVALIRKILPEHRHFLDEEDWLEGLDKLKERSLEIELEVSIFIKNHGAILSEEVQIALDGSIKKVIELKYAQDYLSDTFAGSDIHQVYNNLKNVEQELIAQFRTQSST